MFTITQSPYRPAGLSAIDFVAFVQGSVITINGEAFDFSFMERGSTLPLEAISSEHFGSDVICDDGGIIRVELKVPVGPGATPEQAFPPLLEGKKYGKVIDIHLPAVELPASEVVNG